ncbi:AAA family ATPase [Pilimelia columellifera]|uniref:AAA family ATPase n=1 Tax=Pilimelia columellifera subsp. columellifera TaxID=706583 RepID=A0ABN3N7C9_9ACTN
MNASPAKAAEGVIGAVLGDLARGVSRGVVVDSPPGAGKSTLVVRAARTLAAADPVMIVAQTNEQVDDLVDRLATADPTLPIGRLSAADYRPTPRVAGHDNVMVAAKAPDLAERPVVIGTAAKWATVAEGCWPWAIVDEAYQMRSDALLRVAARFERALFVGDPGQLDPFSTVETGRWSGLTWDPMQSAVAVLLRHNPDLPVHRLPVSWRLPPSAADLVAAAFYPDAPFAAGSAPDDRRLHLGVSAADPFDAVLDQAAATGWGYHELPARHTPRTDAEAVAVCAALVTRLVDRQAVASCEREPGGAPVTPGRIAVGVAHRDQAAAVRAALPARLDGVAVDTANRLQGREFDVTVVLHPLSGRRDATAFHLEAGRLCVLTSRHRQACLVVARAGIAELLDAHPTQASVPLDLPVRFPDGWEAHHALLARLTS